MYFAWMILGLGVRAFLDVNTKAYLNKGYINRLCIKLFRCTQVATFPPSILPLWFCYSGTLAFVPMSGSIYGMVAWIPYIILAIDDWLNGDDDFHKKIKKAANKIKWKMTQPRLIAKPQ